MRYGIIGVGAIGGYYGSKLAYSGQEVHFLSHSDYQFVKERALGISGVDEAFVEKMIETTDAMTPYSPSMKLDYDFHRPMEIHYLYSRPIEIAREAGFRMSKLEMLEAELRFLQATYLSEPQS